MCCTIFDHFGTNENIETMYRVMRDKPIGAMVVKVHNSHNEIMKIKEIVSKGIITRVTPLGANPIPSKSSNLLLNKLLVLDHVALE